jgi:hypothetical protein
MPGNAQLRFISGILEIPKSSVLRLLSQRRVESCGNMSKICHSMSSGDVEDCL